MILKTAHKIALATVASKAIIGARRLAGLGMTASVNRQGVRWNLDLQEGIDFSIYLLGAFEPQTVRSYATLVKAGDVVLDIGANIGAHTLPLAKLVGESGRVIAFEPTAYAFGKLKENAALNPALEKRITAIQCMLMAERTAALPSSLFSSWPLNNEPGLHAKHKGRSMGTSGAVTATLDDAIAELGLARIDFIKIDVDGHELPVLKGGAASIDRFRPRILIELSPYVHAEEGFAFEEVVQFFNERGYRFHDANNSRELPVDADRLREIIPDGSGINAVASCSTQTPPDSDHEFAEV